MNQSLDIPGLFLPAHLRLGQGNWDDYRHAVETICQLKGIDHHLDRFIFEVDPKLPHAEREEAYEERRKNDALCMAIITLNIKDFARYGIPAHPGTHPGGVWHKLVKMHTQRPWWEALIGRLFGWMRRPTYLEVVLLVLLVWSLWLHLATSTEISGRQRW
ncbi:hypothetical protein C8Q79DRAFT_987799 [Trametes meyenii]|nr:hypothetical protein C8Q79DRAFT_987799 [Trametes meyenii]